MPKHVRHSFVCEACCDKIRAFAQILVILRQLPQNLEASFIVPTMMVPSMSMAACVRCGFVDSRRFCVEDATAPWGFPDQPPEPGTNVL